MRRQRQSRRGSRGRWSTLCIAITAGLLVLTVVSAPIASFSTGHVDRAQTLGVASDPNAALALENSVTMHTGNTCSLVNITNNLDADLTVIVTLRDDSTKYGGLVVEGQQHGDSVEFVLLSGAEKQVSLDVAADGSYDGADVFYHVTATAPAMHATAGNRYSIIDNSSETTDCTTTT